MSTEPDGRHLGGIVPTPFEAGGASFLEALRQSERTDPLRVPEGPGPELPEGAGQRLPEGVVEGTTVLALDYADGVVIAGDRRATAGHLISKTDMRKVFPADHWSAIAISGTAGPAMELAEVFSTELEHYEKVEGDPLSLEGKSNKLAHMVRNNLALTLQGLVVVPLFAGVEPEGGDGRIFEYDPIGGRYRAKRHAASGSGSIVARGTLKRGHDPDGDRDGAVRTAVTALFDAAEEDTATGGPDLVRRIYPIVAVIDADGYRELDEDRVGEHVEVIVEERSDRH